VRTAFWDLETTALRASFGQLLCGVIGEFDPVRPLEPKLTVFQLHKYRTPKERCDDSGLALDLAAELDQYDLVIGFNSIMFDKKFLDTRLAKYGYPGSHIARHKDLLYVLRYKFSLQSNSLKNAAKFFFGSTLKTDLSWDTWRLAHAGDRESYEMVIDHCKWDVLELARIWDRVKSVAGDLRA
jgi:uncharacterized protein YprB with RNaseH-like and TPR domain